MLTAIVAFFSPCGFELPKRHLASTLAWLKRESVPTVVAQVIRSDQQPQPVPAGAHSLVYESDHVLFLKENLWNLAARQTDASRLLFIDSDIYFSVDRIFEPTESLLEVYDVIQPFDTAAWLDRRGREDFVRKSAAVALAAGTEPHPGLYHPGFAWAMTRRAFDALGGFFERHPLGGGDTAFSYSLDKRWVAESLARIMPNDSPFWGSQAFREYQAKGVNAGLRVGVLQGVTAYHRWHGSVANRQYCNRAEYLDSADYRLHHRPDGLLQWDTPEDSARAAEYFASRREDG